MNIPVLVLSPQNASQKTGNKLKLRGKIDAKCRDCIYDPHSEGTWRFQVQNCTCLACPLYPVRPITIRGAKS